MEQTREKRRDYNSKHEEHRRSPHKRHHYNSNYNKDRHIHRKRERNNEREKSREQYIQYYKYGSNHKQFRDSNYYYRENRNSHRNRQSSTRRHSGKHRYKYSKEKSKHKYYRGENSKQRPIERKYHRDREPDNYYKNNYKRSRSASPCLDRIEKRHDSYKYEKTKYPSSREEKNRNISFRKSSSYSSNRSSSSSSASKDEGHFKYKIGMLIKDQYQIESFLGDGTFGRVLECKNLGDNQLYAIKVIRPVERYLESAEIEAQIIEDIMKHDTYMISHCVRMVDHFYFEDKYHRYKALVFEKLGDSLYNFIKENKYRGFPMFLIQQFAKQIFEGIGFLHDVMGMTHTDLKPENILLKDNQVEIITSRKLWPKNVLYKEERNIVSSSNTRSISGEREEKEDNYSFPINSTIKIIDFGGATYRTERHSDIINTRQYRSPEVILGCQEWDEKSDIWSLACILVELYTGELFFPTHDNEEHIALIEKICGTLPLKMAANSRKELKKIFNLERVVTGSRVNLNAVSRRKREDIAYAVETLETLDDLIHEEDNIFKDFLRMMFKIDPVDRPSCEQCLQHEFFKQNFSKYTVNNKN